MKTKKSIAKRFRITKNKKVLHRSVNQDHFNARDSGSKTRKKRRMVRALGADKKKVMKYI